MTNCTYSTDLGTRAYFWSHAQTTTPLLINSSSSSAYYMDQSISAVGHGPPVCLNSLLSDKATVALSLSQSGSLPCGSGDQCSSPAGLLYCRLLHRQSRCHSCSYY
ncbi:hypothetical protein AOLI_G00053260 [Acnodon oligacanthus]